MKAVKTVAIVKGRLVKANENKARVFTSKANAVRFIRNLKRVSNSLRWNEVEFITFG